jgi:lysophospholipid acyltransferase (LPLAT)-like uncharacterized protein
MDGYPDRAPEIDANMSETPDHTRLSGAALTAETGRKERFLPAMLKRFAASETVLAIGGFLLACHVWLVRRTNRLVRIPDATFFAPFEEPVIIALWHGEHFLLPYLGRRKDKVNGMVSLHRDGEIVARGGMHLGLRMIRGSGDHGKEFMRKRAVQAFTAMLRVLKRGEHVAMTADVPKVARVAGLGIVTLAKHSGCPIVPVAMGTSRRFRLSNWDRTCVGLPFGRMVMMRAEPIRVARDADDAALEAARRLVEDRLKAITAHGYAVADGEAQP